MASITGIRVFLYVTLWLFAAVLFGLAATRLHYTTHLPPFDPLNNGHDFYDPIVAELLATTIIVILWVPFAVHTIYRKAEYGLVSSFGGELFFLFSLFVLYLVGAAIATSFWGNLLWCRSFWACRILIALVAFAWMGWGVVFALLVISAVFVFANGYGSAGEQMHGTWARGRGSWYGGRTGPVRA